jgi:translation initiation factor 1
MADICNKCGMLNDLCVCEILDKQGVTKIKVYVAKKKFRKFVTIIEGIDNAQINRTAKELKHKLACGGTAKDGVVVLQGNHKKKIPAILKLLGYPEESIEVN